MAQRRIKVPASPNAIASAAAGQVITFNLDLGLRYHQIDVEFTDGANAQTLTTVLGDVIVYRNDIAERTHTAKQLDDLNGKNGSQYTVATQTQGTSGTDRVQCLPIYFFEPWRKNIAEADGMAWSADAANGFKTFQVKITVAVALSATAGITLYAWVDDPLPPPTDGNGNKVPQSLKKVYRTNLTASGASNEFGSANFPNHAPDMYQGVLFYQPDGTGTIQYVTIKNNGNSGVTIWDKVSTYDNVNFLKGRGMNPPAANAAAGVATYAWEADVNDPISGAVLPAQNGLWFKVEYTSAAAATGNIVALIERLGPLD